MTTVKPLVFYDISTGSILKKYGIDDLRKVSEDEKKIILDRAATDLIPRIRTGEIWFPFQRFFRGNPAELFENLKRIDLTVRKGQYRLRSYYPKYGTYLPPRFRGESIVVEGTRDTYVQADVLSDHYIESVRLKAKRYDQIRSILECWVDDACVKEILKTVLQKERITPATLRDAIYETTPETKIFNPTWARALIKLVLGPNTSGKKWLDISAGWGDRLLAAMSLGMDYIGFDPNIELKEGHSQMIKDFGDPKRHRVIYEPFEKATIPPGPYDVVMSSPPYFNLEDYAPGQEGQSIVSYPNFIQWMVWFLFASLSKAWDNLKEGGYLILHLGDAKTIVTSEAANIFIENYLPGSSWEGIIGLQGEAGFPRPVWVWKKVARNAKREIWEPQMMKSQGPLPYSQRTLFETYPELQRELLGFYATKYAPNYLVKRTSVNTIRDHVEVALPNTNRFNIDEILQDDLMLYSVLEVLGPEPIIAFATDLVRRLPNMTPELANTLGAEKAPYYLLRKKSVATIRDHVAQALPKIPRQIIDGVLRDDLMITTILEKLGIEKTITWSVAMVKLAYRI